MKIKDMIQLAIRGNAEMAKKVVDFYRFQAGATYQETLAVFQKYKPDFTAADLEDLLYE